MKKSANTIVVKMKNGTDRKGNKNFCANTERKNGTDAERILVCGNWLPLWFCGKSGEESPHTKKIAPIQSVLQARCRICIDLVQNRVQFAEWWRTIRVASPNPPDSRSIRLSASDRIEKNAPIQKEKWQRYNSLCRCRKK